MQSETASHASQHPDARGPGGLFVAETAGEGLTDRLLCQVHKQTQDQGLELTRMEGGDLSAQLAQRSDSHAILICDTATGALCAALEQGHDLEAALLAWQVQVTQEVLPLVRRYRRRIALIGREAFCAAPAAALERGLAFLGRDPIQIPQVQTGPAPDPVHRVIAEWFLISSERARLLNGDLEAQMVMASLEAVQHGAQSLAAAEAYRARAEQLSDSLRAVEAGQQQIDILLAQAQAHEQQMAASSAAQGALLHLEQKVALQQAQLQMLQKTLEGQAGQEKQLAAERAEKLARGRSVQSLRGQVEALTQACAERDDRLEALWASTSWRITAPIRSVKLALTGGAPASKPAPIEIAPPPQPAPEKTRASAQPRGAQPLRKTNAPAPVKITVVTVVYCDADGLEETIESVRSQQFLNFEYVVVDGASKDRTAEVLQARKSQIDVLISEPDKGIYDAMNKGIAAAGGEYVVFMNAGDSFVDQNTLSSVAEDLNGEDVVYGHRYYMRKSGPVLQKSHEVEYVRKRMPYCHQAAYYKRTALKKHPFNLVYKYAADYNQVVELFVAGCAFKQVDKVLCNFVPGGASESGIRPYLDVLKIQFDNFGSDAMKDSEYMKGFLSNAPGLLQPYGQVSQSGKV